MASDSTCEFCLATVIHDWCTPAGICKECACSVCRGFKLLRKSGLPHVEIGIPRFSNRYVCAACDGTGTRISELRMFHSLLGDFKFEVHL